MKMKLLAGAIVLGSVILGACGDGYYGDGYYAQYAPPPPRYYGPMGPAPGVGFVWTNGYWGWGGHDWRWREGRWMRPPRGRSYWVAPEWRREGRGYRMRRGYWR